MPCFFDERSRIFGLSFMEWDRVILKMINATGAGRHLCLNWYDGYFVGPSGCVVFKDPVSSAVQNALDTPLR